MVYYFIKRLTLSHVFKLIESNYTKNKIKRENPCKVRVKTQFFYSIKTHFFFFLVLHQQRTWNDNDMTTHQRYKK